MRLKPVTRGATTGEAAFRHINGTNQTRLSVHDCSLLLNLSLAKLTPRRSLRRENPTMFSFRDLFQWERFVTPSIIKLFFWLVVAIIILFGLSGIASALQMMAVSAGVGVFILLGSLLGV